MLLTACASKDVPSGDSDKPIENGQIQMVVFQDENKNGIMVADETGVQERIWLTPGKCAAKQPELQVNTNPDGIWIFTDLKPDRYCIAYMGNEPIRSRMEVSVDLSKGREALVFYSVIAD